MIFEAFGEQHQCVIDTFLWLLQNFVKISPKQLKIVIDICGLEVWQKKVLKNSNY